MLHRNPFLVGQHQPHNGHREQPGFRVEPVGEGKGAYDEHQGDAVLQVIGNEKAIEQENQDGSANHADDDADD